MVEDRYLQGEYLSHNPDWHSEDSPYKARWIRDLLASADVHPQTIVEIGCGAGEILLELSRTFPQARLQGFEVSPTAFALCEPKATDRVTFYLEDVLKSQRPKVDLAMAIDVFEHVPDYIGFIKDMRGLAEYKLFHIPLDLSVQGLMRPSGLANSRAAVGHLHYFTKETALATLADSGLEIVEWRYTCGAEELPNRKPRTRALNVVRKGIRAVNADIAVRFLGGYSLLVLTR